MVSNTPDSAQPNNLVVERSLINKKRRVACLVPRETPPTEAASRNGRAAVSRHLPNGYLMQALRQFT